MGIVLLNLIRYSVQARLSIATGVVSFENTRRHIQADNSLKPN